MICFVLGRILLVEAALMALPMAVALGYGESAKPFLLPILLLILAGLLLSAHAPRKTALYARDGLAVVSLAWLAM